MGTGRPPVPPDPIRPVAPGCPVNPRFQTQGANLSNPCSGTIPLFPISSVFQSIHQMSLKPIHLVSMIPIPRCTTLLGPLQRNNLMSQPTALTVLVYLARNSHTLSVTI